ncbi:Pre-mRNA cleavage complex II protein Clp1-domain-containing protein [Radiomyces spectabilis]|uniref:Pre-mRNA cleavage complex II protein Clp1-domain-containing protein n=1 Tax=Radiomyces spectabilis TaxID=64574 RepID=UPI00221FA42B|nr:Pre-mRNA cleavage complex II protein Clp1-domain-containing protein [Radiomyces spectabilis]KAI8381040.1 Pre-mRNA cleavage complex II protein Clp1-domain-containing protein [Radiomyces spectabilis]
MQDKNDLQPVREIELEADHEFRFEVEFNKRFEIKLLKGTAEIFGTELAVGVTYSFSGRKAAVYTWHGCTLEIRGQFLVEYTANETPMTSYFNTHVALQQLRQSARDNKEQGPRVLVIGPHDVGKTSLCKLLVSYAQRQGEKPIYVSLDTSEGSITMPGTVTATTMNNIIDVEEGFGSSATTAASMGSTTMPLAYYYGYENPSESVKLYKLVVSRLAHSVKCRIAADEESRTSGLIIDTAGLIDQVGYELIQHAIQEFSVNVVIVLGHERLYSDMTRILKDRSSISVIKLTKSGGVVERDRQFKTQLQRAKIQEYFYGTPKCELFPYSMLINMSDVSIWRVGEPIAPSSALPIGMDSTENETQVVKVDNHDMCLHSILAILNADPSEPENKLLESNIAGFIYVSDVDEEKQKMAILSPAPGRLPRRHLLMGAFKWMET